MTWGDGLGTVETSADGQFDFKGLPSLPLKISVRKKGFANASPIDLTLQPGEHRTDLRLVLGQSHHIAGRVTDTDGAPVVNVGVGAYTRNPGGSVSESAQTDEQGRYRIEGLGEGPAEMSVTSGQYEGQNSSGVPVDRDDIDFVLKKREAATATLIGKVVDWKTRVAVKDFSVWSDSGTKTAPDPSATGQFIAQGLHHRSSYDITIASPGYLPLTTSFNIPQTGDRFERTFKLGTGGSVKGRVVGQGTKAPLPGVRVEIPVAYDENRSRLPEQILMTDDNGRFVFRSIAPGNRLFVFTSSEESQLVFRKIPVTHGMDEDLGDIVMGGSRRIRGRLVRDPGDRPIAGARIDATGYNDLRPANVAPYKTFCQSDEDGRFEFTGLTEGQYTLSVGEYRLGTNVDLRFNESAEIVLRVGATRVTGRVLYRGEPQRPIVLFSQPDAGLQCWATMDENLRFSANLSPGQWQVIVSSKDIQGVSLHDMIRITEEETVEKTFRLPGSRILGRVVDTGDKPLSNVRVFAGVLAPSPDPTMPRRGLKEVRTVWDGTFTIIGVEQGTYSVTAVSEESGMGRADNVQVPLDDDSQQVLIRIGAEEGATVVSKVFDLNTDKPVPNSWARLDSKDTQGSVNIQRSHSREGLVRIDGVLEGTYTLSVGANGYSTARRELEVKTGQVVEVEDAIYAAGWLRWTILDRDGRPIVGVRYSVTPNDPLSIEKVHEGRTDPDGVSWYGELYPGDYTGTATFPDGSTLTETFTIIAFKSTEKVTKRD